MNSKYIEVNQKPFIMISGEVHNSSSSSEAFMEPIWDKADALGLNTLALPVTWEMVEEEEGDFNFDIVDALIRQARAHRKKIIFLWFGAMKNAQCTYAPAWVKEDLTRFPRAEVERGKTKTILKNFYDMPYTALSVFSEKTKQADANAFRRLMKHIRIMDRTAHTVVCVQVENETGVMGAAREHSDIANRLFEGQVPQGLAQYLMEHRFDMAESTRKAVEAGADSGTWTEVFGDCAEEIFQAYYTASYVDAVAAAGKGEYPLPMFANAWLSQGQHPGEYPSGGPVHEMLEVWKFAAPHIDVLAPDIYVKNFLEICDEYTRSDNPLCVVETSTHSHLAPRLVYAIGHYHALCFGPFAFEDMGQPFDNLAARLFGVDTSDPLLAKPQDVETFAWYANTLGDMIPILAEHYDTEDLQAVIGEKPEENAMDFGTIRIRAITSVPGAFDRPDGCALAVRMEKDEFYVIAGGCILNFESTDSERPNLDFLKVEEGTFEYRQWQPGRRLNGDETASMMFDKPTLLRMKVMQYQ